MARDQQTGTAHADVAEAENLAPIQGTAVGWWRRDLEKADADAYWRDVHGVLVARAPGLYSYRQLHLDRPVADLWPALSAAGIGTAPGEAERIDGMNQLLFRTQDDLTAFATSGIVTDHVFHDERNLVTANATLWWRPGEAVTLVDRTGDPAPQGQYNGPGFAVLFRRAARAEAPAFARHVIDRIAGAWASRDGVVRLRVQILGPYDPQSWRSPGVDHDWPQDHHYHAWIDLMTTSDTEARGLLDQGMADQLRTLVSAVHVYPVPARYTLVWQGRPTDVGLRGWPAVRTIRRAKAANQLSPDLKRAVYGVIVDGAAEHAR